jgi:hypothetical protein
MDTTIRTLILGLLALCFAWPVTAGELRKLGNISKAETSPYPSAPKGRVCDAPGSNFYPDYHPNQYPPYGKVVPAPAYAWGYFGARSKQFSVNHSGYYRDRTQTIFSRGF